ncbi:MAG: type II secretion system F family protein, partial [Acidimicrobiales bacterium]
MAELTHLGLAAAIPACGLAAIWLLRTPPARAGRRRLPPDLSRRLLRAVAALGAIGLLTRWPVAAVAAAVAAWFLPEVLGTGTGARDEIVKTEAVAAWTEMLRDTLAGPSALDGAIEATAPLAPEPIRPQVAALAARLARQPAPYALARFSHDVD